MFKGTIALSLCIAAPASAAIIPSWRVNTITPEAMAASFNGGVPLLTPQSRCLSLMVTLTEGSLFNVAGLDLTGLFANDEIRFFQRNGGQWDFGGPHYPDDIENSPGRILAYDTWLGTAVLGEDAARPGRLNGTGTAQVGNVAVTPTSGSNRIGRFFNVAWGATPNNGGDGTFEIANITFSSGVTDGFTEIPLQFGRVYDSLNPQLAVALPPIPVAVPEPLSLWPLAALMVFCRRQKSGTPTAPA